MEIVKRSYLPHIKFLRVAALPFQMMVRNEMRTSFIQHQMMVTNMYDSP